MKVLVVGSGGREHALAWKIARESGIEGVLAAPGSAGMASVAECVGVGAADIEGLALLAEERGVDLTVVGPEAPLAAGIVDSFRSRGLKIFGPDREGAKLEASKAFMKEVLVEAGVPTAAYRDFTEAGPARAWARELGAAVVVKADGLAAGKGVVVCRNAQEADQAITTMLEGGRFGDAGRRIVVEEFMRGEEVSFMALSDGRSVLALASSQDHKPVFDGDRGPNTGGMGAYSPAPVLTDELEAMVTRDIVEPTVAALRARGIDYRGVLYAGLMVTDEGPRVLEYNVRFGDPECQPIMTRMRSSLVELMEAALEGRLDEVEADWYDSASVCVVMASQGYPGAYDTGHVISGMEEAQSLPGVTVFHAGTARDGDGRWTTAGGRVLGVTGGGATVAEAAETAYRAAGIIDWPGVHYRTDIAHRAVEREQAGGRK